MEEKSWAQQIVDDFFDARTSPSRVQCDETARALSGASVIRPVDVPGSLSYTVVCTDRRQGHPDVVLSFREAGSGLNSDMVRLAMGIHGSLVPEVVSLGIMKDADPPLGIYSMTYLPGIACLEVLSHDIGMDSGEEARHVDYIKHLARYFARAWSSPQSVNAQARAERQVETHSKLMTFNQCSSPVLTDAEVAELAHCLPVLFSQDYPQVLTHGDLSVTNILVDTETYEITGIVDWSLAKTLPFGLELDCLYLMTGYMDLRGWHNYACRPRLYESFWAEFWAASGIGGGGRRKEVRTMAESAARIGAILRYAFKRKPDGSSSAVLLGSDRVSEYLKPWFKG